jgi:hypothetical protein
MEHQFFIRQQNIKLYRSLVAASEAAAAKADARQEKLLKLLAEEVANDPPQKELMRSLPASTACLRDEACAGGELQRGLWLWDQTPSLLTFSDFAFVAWTPSRHTAAGILLKRRPNVCLGTETIRDSSLSSSCSVGAPP